LRKIFMDKIPIKKPTTQQAALFEALVPMVQAAKAESQKSGDSELKSVASFLEEVIDACVMEVYFSDHMAEHRLGIMAHVTPLLQDFDAAAPPAKQVAQHSSSTPRPTTASTPFATSSSASPWTARICWP
jgi:adenine-specific DNA-methyltransferase